MDDNLLVQLQGTTLIYNEHFHSKASGSTKSALVKQCFVPRGII